MLERWESRSSKRFRCKSPSIARACLLCCCFFFFFEPSPLAAAKYAAAPPALSPSSVSSSFLLFVLVAVNGPFGTRTKMPS